MAALTLCLVLALAAVASAQSAGDNQYVDPFAGAKAPAKGPTSGGGNAGSQQAGSAPATPSASLAETPAAQSASVDPETGVSTPAGAKLPATGAPILLMFAAGAALLAAGFALRLAVGTRPA